MDTTLTHAPIRFMPDFTDLDNVTFFVSDIEGDQAELSDRVIAVNGSSSFATDLEPYIRYSTLNKLWWELAKMLPQKSETLLPAHLYRDTLELKLERANGERYKATLPYRDPDDLRWRGPGEPRYSGFDLAYSTATYDLYQNFAGRRRSSSLGTASARTLSPTLTGSSTTRSSTTFSTTRSSSTRPKAEAARRALTRCSDCRRSRSERPLTIFA